jgi:hypothetical protein
MAKCLYCGERIVTSDPLGAVFVKYPDEEGRIGRREQWHPGCKRRAMENLLTHASEQIERLKERWGALPLGEDKGRQEK